MTGTRNQDAQGCRGESYRRYLVAFCVPVVLGCVLVFAVFAAARTEAVFAYTGTAEDLVTAWKVDLLPNHDADVVVAGDLTGLFGVAPRIIERETGLKAYNLALTIGPFVAGGTDLLDAYLRTNRAPKLIILYLNPWTTPARPDDMVSEADRFASQYPGFQATFALDKIGNWRSMARYLLTYPEQAVIFVRKVVGRVLHAEADARRRSAEIRDILERNDGWLPFARGPVWAGRLGALPANCSFAARDVRPDRAWFASFRRRYTTPDTRVLVLLAPIPECDQSLHLLLAAYAGLLDLPPAAMENRYFVRDLPRRSHLLEAGAEVNTRSVAVAVKRALGGE